MSPIVSQKEPTQEEIEAAAKEISAAINTFMQDVDHERYILCKENREAIEAYMTEHQLFYTPDTLHRAFVALSEQNRLQLYEVSKLPTDSPKETPVKSSNHEKPFDGSTNLEEQWRARKNTPMSGPRDSNRDAFITAKQNQPKPKATGRVHL